MSDARDIVGKLDVVQQLLSAKFGVRRRDTLRMLKKIGRRLPKRMHARVMVLVKAEQLAGHPKLARQLDHGAVAQAYDALRTHLEAIDVAEQRKGRVLRFAGLMAFYILFVCAAFVIWLWWTGYV
ncbi:MAG: hypothetical protein ABJL67_02870 [Sulfitobacter sp.]